MMRISESVKRYLDREKAEYAIMITGEWGAGKTHYVKNNLMEILSSRSDENKIIYISLNGASNLKDIHERIVFEYITYNHDFEISFATFKSISNLGASIPQMSKWLKPLTEIKNLFASRLETKMDFSNVILIIDDIERINFSKLSTMELFGYINSNFIENKFVKTILVCNENEINDSNYNKIKEKMIGRVFEYKANTECIVRDIIKDQIGTNEQLQELLSNKIDTIMHFVSELAFENYRTFKFCLDIYMDLLPNISEKYINESFESIFSFILIISMEFKEGRLDIRDKDDSKGFSRIQFIALREAKSDDEKYLKTFYQNYIQGSILPFDFNMSIFNYILTGELNIEDFKSSIEDKYGKNEISAYREHIHAIKDHFLYEEDELQNHVDCALQLVLYVGGYNPYEYFKLYEKITFLVEKEYIRIDSNFKEKFFEGFKLAIENNKNLVANSRGLGMSKKYDEVQMMMVEEINKSHDKFDENSKKLLFESWVNAINGGEDDYYEVCGQLEQVSIFKLIDIDYFSDEIIKMKNRSIIRVNSFLHQRYLRISNARDFYNDQIEGMKELIIFLSQKRESKTITSLKKDVIGELISTLEKTIDHLTLENLQ